MTSMMHSIIDEIDKIVDMEEKIADYLKKPARFSAKKIKRSFNINFTIDKIADKYEQLLDSIQP